MAFLVCSIGVTVPLLIHASRSLSAAEPDVLPADQPKCSTRVVTKPLGKPVFTISYPYPQLGTTCQYYAKTGLLNGGGVAQIRPQDLRDFTTFIRSLPDKQGTCQAGESVSGNNSTATDVVEIRLLYADNSFSQINVTRLAKCTVLTDANRSIGIPNSTLRSSEWGGALLADQSNTSANTSAGYPSTPKPDVPVSSAAGGDPTPPLTKSPSASATNR